MKAAIIIVNWNGKKFLQNCLDSVYKQTYKNFQVYFVDNGSIDDSSEFVNENYPKVTIIKLDKNYGFAKGNNIGIKEAFKDELVEYIVCLNNDTIVDKNWLKELAKTAQKGNTIGAVQSKILLCNKKTLHSTGGILKIDFSSESRGFGEKDKNQYDHDEEVEIAIGCSLLIKRHILKTIGFFEERFFCYKEDDDLCIRIKLFGYKIFYSAKSIVYHFHSSTFKAKSYKKLYYNERNRIFNLITYGSFTRIIKSINFTIKRYLNNGGPILKNNNSKTLLVLFLIKAYIDTIPYFAYFIKKRILYSKKIQT